MNHGLTLVSDKTVYIHFLASYFTSIRTERLPHDISKSSATVFGCSLCRGLPLAFLPFVVAIH